jgi:hypothetical protein
LLLIGGAVLPGERPSFFSRAVFEKLGLFSAFRQLRPFRGETEFFSPTNQKNSVSSLFDGSSVLSGERPSFFSRAVFEKLGLFSAYRWRCSFRGETEFFSPSIPEKLGLFAV